MKCQIYNIASVLLSVIYVASSQNVYIPEAYVQPFAQLNYQFSQIEPPQTAITAPVLPYISKYQLFSDSFYKLVQNTPQLLKVFDVSFSPFEASLHMYKTCKLILKSIGVEHAEYASKYIGDAFYLTISSMTQDAFIYAIADIVALYLGLHGVLDRVNAEPKAAELANAVLKNYPEANNENHLTLLHALCSGVLDFVNGSGDHPKQTVPSLPMSVAKQFFAMTSVSEPVQYVSVIARPGRVPDAYDAYGINTFSTTFVDAVDSSVSLQSIFFPRQDASILAQAWYDAVVQFCVTRLKFSNTYFADRIKIAISQTLNLITKYKYVRNIGNGFALVMFMSGILEPEQAVAKAQNLAQNMEVLFNDIGPNAELSEKLSIIFTSLLSLTPPQFSEGDFFTNFCHHLESEFYAVTIVKKPILN